MTPRDRGPALIFITTSGDRVPVDTEPVMDPRERDIYRALSDRAARLADKADADATGPAPDPGTGNYL